MLSKASGEGLAKMIGKASLFSGLSQKQLSKISKSGTERKFEAGTVILNEGETGVGFYLIIDGKAEVRKRKKVISTLSSGDVFGEMSLIDNQPRSADVIAVTPTTTFILSSWAFAGVVTGDPEIALGMMKILVGRLRATNSSLSE
jgi:CRP-like cAMP-binding protein